MGNVDMLVWGNPIGREGTILYVRLSSIQHYNFIPIDFFVDLSSSDLK